MHSAVKSNCHLVVVLVLCALSGVAMAQECRFLLDNCEPGMNPPPPPSPQPPPQLPSPLPAPTPTAASPSFDCATHFGPDEIAICRSGRLSYLDRQLNAVFGALRPTLDSARQIRLRDEQRVWLRQRTACLGSESCLIAAYESRIAQLQNWR